DAKSQVTIRYSNGRPDSIDTVVLSTQHAPGIEHKKLSESVIEEVIKPVLPKSMIKGKISYLVNPTGAFEIGGPKGDCGVTGRKIIVDTYGGSAPHGGGARSEEHTSELQSLRHLVCRLLPDKKNKPIRRENSRSTGARHADIRCSRCRTFCATKEPRPSTARTRSRA